MHKGNPLHQLLVLPQPIPHLHRILDVVNIQHKESVQMTVSQSSVSEHPALGSLRLVKLPATEDERRQILLHLLRKGQQFLCIRFLRPGLLRSLLLQILLFQQKLLILSIIQPCLYGRRAFRPGRLHRRQYRPSGIHSPSGAGFPHLLPELLP